MIKEYAYIVNGFSVRMFDEDWVNALIASNNSKANYIIPIITNPQPQYNSQTQKLVENLILMNDSYVRDWNIVEKTQQELYDENNKTYTSYEFLLRLTPQERAGIRAAAYSDPNSMTADFLHLAQTAQEVNTMDPVTIAGMDYLVSVGLLTQQRRNEILS